MSAPSPILDTPVAAHRAAWRDYLELGKPRVVSLIVFTAVVGMFLAAPGWPPLAPLLFGVIGIALTASGGAAFNHVLDWRVDALMLRTRHRPLPNHRLTETQGLSYAAILVLAGTALMAWRVNLLSAALTFVSAVGYAFIYTLYLKRSSAQGVVIGGAAGAAPPLLGWTAVTGHVDAGALVLFLIIFIWTPPHFWALAIHRRDDYAKARIPVLSVTRGVVHTKRQILLYTLLLTAMSLLPLAIGMSGLAYLAVALALDGVFLWQAWRLKVSEDERLPMRVFRYSIWYLALLFAALLADHHLPPVALR